MQIIGETSRGDWRWFV